MAKELVTGKKHRTIEQIMKDPNQKAVLMNLVDQAVNAKVAIAGKQAEIKGLRDAAIEELGLKPALFNSYVAMLFNNDYQNRKEGLEQQLTLVELVMSAAGITYTPTSGDE